MSEQRLRSLTDQQAKIVENFKQHMKNVVIPKIEETIFKRQKAAAKIRYRIIK